MEIIFSFLLFSSLFSHDYSSNSKVGQPAGLHAVLAPTVCISIITRYPDCCFGGQHEASSCAALRPLCFSRFAMRCVQSNTMAEEAEWSLCAAISQVNKFTIDIDILLTRLSIVVCCYYSEENPHNSNNNNNIEE